MDRRGKGLRVQRKVRKHFEDQGYLVHIIQHSKWSKDLFGLWDGFYITQEGEVVWIQIKANVFPTLKPFKQWCEKWKQHGQLIKWVDRKGIKIKNVRT